MREIVHARKIRYLPAAIAATCTNDLAALERYKSVAMPTTKQLSRTLEAIAASPKELSAPEAQHALEQALASKDPSLLVQAANIIAEHQLSVHTEALCTAYRALRSDAERGKHRDAGAVAKTALIAALDAVEAGVADLFADAAGCVQLERGKNSLRDTAAALRAHAVLALARVGHIDLWPILGAALGDRDDGLRLSAARAVAHRRHRDGAGLLLLRLGAGDSIPEVLIECLRGLFAIAPDLGERYARDHLSSAGPEQYEQLLHALGTAPSDSAVELLEAELAARSLGDERAPIIAAIGLSLRPKARALLLELVTSDRSSDAQAALSALAIHRYDTRLAEQVRELTANSRELSQRVRALFG
jgi:hypothetical protein